MIAEIIPRVGELLDRYASCAFKPFSTLKKTSVGAAAGRLRTSSPMKLALADAHAEEKWRRSSVPTVELSTLDESWRTAEG